MDVSPQLQFAGLYVAAGHEGSGLCLGPETARMLWDYISGIAPGQEQDEVYESLLPSARLTQAEH